MLCKILKSFPYAVDGINVKQAVVGAHVKDIADDLLEGLHAGGFIGPPDAPENKMDETTLETGAGAKDAATAPKDAAKVPTQPAVPTPPSEAPTTPPVPTKTED